MNYTLSCSGKKDQAQGLGWDDSLRLAGRPKGTVACLGCQSPTSRFCRDRVQSTCGRQIKRITGKCWTRVERGIHFEPGQYFLAPACTQNCHAALNIADV